MASTAGQITQDLFGFDFRRLVHAVCARDQGGISSRLLAGEDLTTRAVASAGLAALFTLPLLLLSSVVLAAPLAVPAAIGLGYLAVSHALAARHRRRAALINTVILCGLVGWLLLFLLIGEGQLSRAGLTAALMAPLFAAAPAFARSIIATKTAQPASAAPIPREAALDRIARLDEFAPSEPVLILDGEGTVLQERPALGSSPVPMKADTVPRSPLMKAAKTAIAPSCDIGEVVTFALRHAGAKAEAKKVGLTSTAEADITAACDRQVGRRILHYLIDNALNDSEAGGAIRVLARRLRGVVLLRVAYELGADASDAEGRSDEPLDVTALRSLVEGAGGTLVVDCDGVCIVLSVRLDVAVHRPSEERVDECCG